MADGVAGGGRRRVSFGAIVAVAAVLAGSIALIVVVAPLMQRFWDKVEEPVKVVVEERRIEWVEATVEYEETDGANSVGRVVTRLAPDGSDAGDLRIEATREALAFDRIEEAAGWPPDEPGYFDGGLEFYRVDLVIAFSDGTRAETRPTRIAVTDRPGVYYLYAPVAGAGEARPAQARVLQFFETDHLGICALARFEAERRGSE